ncbi:M1 family aminopeptidase [Danxiaibacter flavus]|uniref:Aminopeptidase N n=1 Tax=Danxiaibacter flavus TaxID=3049108 RepID=A0ABV3ZEW2_9BACT|nr:M1 family aminopeptidase [Chitinophagaceae bacterium DXS]
MKKRVLLSLFLAVTCFISYAQIPFSLIDVQHYQYNLAVSDSNNLVKGKALITFVSRANATTVMLNLVKKDASGKGMLVSGVTRNNQPVQFMQDSDHVVLNMPVRDNEQYVINIAYEGVPADGLIISTNKFGKRTFFSDNWPNRAHNWIPCNDYPSDKSSVEFIVTAPDHYQVVASGLQVEETNLPDHLKLTHWKEDIAISTKIYALGIADFAVNYVGNVECIPVYSWVYPQQKERGFKDYSLAQKILPWYIKRVGPYEYKKLANIQSKTIFGGVENAGTIFYFENSVGDKGIESLLAHEIAHQWFGDAASETDWPHLWLSEGFATYMTHLYLEDNYGTDSLKKRMIADRADVIKLSKKKFTPVVDTTGSKAPMNLLNANSYQKGGWILHMLRNKLGDSLFWQSIRKYYATYSGKNATTEDLQKIFEKVSGQNLNDFFEQWLYTTGQPELQVKWNYDTAKKAVSINIVQSQAIPFKFPLEIQVGDKKVVYDISERNTSKEVIVDKAPQAIVLDPDVKLLYHATLNRD